MNNKKFAQLLIDDCHCVVINKLFWIAGMIENSDLKDLLNDDMRDRDIAECFPGVAASEHYQSYVESGDILQALIDFGKYGFIAELYHPRHYNFSFKEDGSYLSCSISSGASSITYVYAESVELLVKEIKKNADKMFEEDMANDRKKKRSVASK